MKLMTHKILLQSFQNTSWLFGRMDHKFHNRTASQFGTTLWGCFWIPVTIYIVLCVFRKVPNPPLVILTECGLFGYLLLQCGILDQLYDLIVLCPQTEIYIHHFTALLLGLMLLDWVPIEQKILVYLYFVFYRR